MFPAITISAIESFTGRDLPVAIWVPLGGLGLILPVTLTYVIVVQHAMDVRVVLRHGLQYALARRSVIVLQILFSAVVVLWLAVSIERFGFVARAALITGGIAIIVLFGRLATQLSTWIESAVLPRAVSRRSDIERTGSICEFYC